MSEYQCSGWYASSKVLLVMLQNPLEQTQKLLLEPANSHSLLAAGVLVFCSVGVGVGVGVLVLVC